MCGKVRSRPRGSGYRTDCSHACLASRALHTAASRNSFCVVGREAALSSLAVQVSAGMITDTIALMTEFVEEVMCDVVVSWRRVC